MFRSFRPLLAVVVLLVAAANGLAEAPELKLPPEVKGATADFIFVTADTPGKVVRWKVLDDGLTLMPFDKLKDTKVAILVARKPGTYRLHAVTAVGDEPSEIVMVKVVIGDPVPPPLPPIPDTFAADVQTAFTNSPGTAAEKAEWKSKLTALYAQSAKTVKDGRIVTTADLKKVLKDSSTDLIPADALVPVRQLVAGELAKVLPTSVTAPLEDGHRTAAAGFFTKIATALETAK